MADLRPNEVEKCRENFDVFDLDGSSTIDACDLSDLLRSLDLRPTDALVEKNGGTTKRGEKRLTLEEFLPIYSQVRKEKESGTVEDFMEGLKVYDKSDNGTMLSAELYHVLLSLGEKMTELQVDDIFKSCLGPEDEDGFVRYELFCKNVTAGPFPEEK